MVVEHTVVGGVPFFGDLQWRMSYLSIIVGGWAYTQTSGFLLHVYGFQGPLMRLTRSLIERHNKITY